MNKKPLGELLQAADTPSDELSSTPSEMAAAVRRRRRKQVRVRFVAAGAVAMLGAAATVWGLLGSTKSNPDEMPIAKGASKSNHSPLQQPAKIAQSIDAPSTNPAEVLSRLRRQRAERENSLAMLLSVEREIETRAKLREIRRRIAAISPDIPVAEETAIVLLASADLKLRHYGQTKSAADDYRRVIELFPMSVWAVSATKHLQTMMP